MIKLGAFGVGTHIPANDPSKQKERRFIVVKMLDGHPIVIFGYGKRSPKYPHVVIRHESSLGKRMGLTKTTHFRKPRCSAPLDYFVRGFFATEVQQFENDLDVLQEHDLWLEILALLEP